MTVPAGWSLTRVTTVEFSPRLCRICCASLTGTPRRTGTDTIVTGGEAEARDRLRRIKDVGFDDVLCMTPLDALDDLERLRDAAQ